MRIFHGILILLILTSGEVSGGEVFQVAGDECSHGLKDPPVESDFTIFVFCDDALGTQIGVILTRPAAGPASERGGWSIYDRFWQEGAWMVDVKALTWSPSGEFLYVSTSEVYGEEALFEVDLMGRSATKLLSGDELDDHVDIERVEEGVLFANGRQFDMKR